MRPSSNILNQGHAFMSGESFHHRLEQEILKKKRLEDFQDFVDIVDTCEQ